MVASPVFSARVPRFRADAKKVATSLVRRSDAPFAPCFSGVCSPSARAGAPFAWQAGNAFAGIVRSHLSDVLSPIVFD